jgi:DNA polymerase III epsilon subunit-like protein
MCYLAWDTETTGLPMSRGAATKDNTHLFDNCRIVSLAFVMYSTKGRELSSYHSVVYPDTFQVTATEIHGITHDHALMYGKKFEEIYEDFVKASKGHILVAHNSNFDKNVLFSECYRRGLSVEPFEAITFVCTLDLVKDIYLMPKKLEVIYEELTGKKLDDAHNALADARACGVVYPLLRDMERTVKPSGIPRVILKASDVASMIGKNSFKKPQEVLDNLWYKYSPKTFKGKTKDQIAREAIESSPVARGILEDAQRFKSTNSSAVEQKTKAAMNQLHNISGLTNADLDAAKEYVRKTLFTNHGIRHEDRTAEKDPTLKTDDTFYTYEVCTIEGTRYDIVGRIDRIVANEDGTLTVVEIKNRARGLFKSVREYENIQCQTYMEMLNIDTCKLIEQHNEDMMTHHIRRDKDYWSNTVLPKLKNFCECFHSMISA